MQTISLCMIVRNEETVLQRCLDSVCAFVDEIVIVDTGSIDRTIEIAARYTDRIYHFQWQNDFAAARNAAFSKGRCDYLMWMDADDVLQPQDQQRFSMLKGTLESDVDAVVMPYYAAVRDDGTPILTYVRERLIRRGSGFKWCGAVHECIPVSGKIVRWDAAVTHRKFGCGDPDRNLRIYNAILQRGDKLDARAQFYYARELMAHGLDRSAAAWFEYFLDGGQGWLENNLQACRDLAACYRRLGKSDAAFGALTRALKYAQPRPEICCDFGYWHTEQRNWQTAAWWYEQALYAPDSAQFGGFSEPEYSGYIPLLQLCVCHYHMGDLKAAAEFNERAGMMKPNDKTVLENRAFFERTEKEVLSI